MKTYEQKLLDPRWISFAEGFRERVKERIGGEEPECYGCGKSGPLDVHHRRYFRDCEPWQYEDEDLILVCRECHKRIHAVSNEFYSWLISLEPSSEYEARYLLDELVKSQHPRIALARAKNAVRTVNHNRVAEDEL